MRIPIRLKFSILIFLLILIIVGVIFWFTLGEVRESLTREIELQGRSLARIISLDAEDPLITNDDLYLARLITDAVKSEGVRYALITDKEGIIRAHNNIEYVGKPKRKFTLPSGLKKVTLPILLAGKKKIGTVIVGLGTERVERTTNTMQVILILVAAGGLTVGILGTLILSNYLTRPINDLVSGVKGIAKGNFNQRVRRKSNDEIGDLTLAFNEMAKSLKEKEQIKDAFRRYVSQQVAEEIFKDPTRYINTLRGIRKKITILFADIRGFTPLSERLPAEEVVMLLNEVLSAMTDVIFQYEGTIDKFIGDCIMAVFGAPVVHMDDTNRAIMAAVDIQKAIGDINRRKINEDKELIHIGIGINVGEAVVGNIGAKDRLDYTVIGDSVNLAARLEKVAGRNEIIVSEQVIREADVPITFTQPKLIKIKGKEKPVKCYWIVNGIGDNPLMK